MSNVATWNRGAAFRLLGVGAALALLVSGCGSSGTTSDSEAGNSGPAAAAISRLDAASKPVDSKREFGTPVDTSGLAGKTIFYVPFSAGIPYMVAIQANLKNAVEAVGAHLYLCDGKQNPSGINACLDQAEQQHPAAVVTDYIDYSFISAAATRLSAAHIPILINGVELPPGMQNTPTVAFGSTQTYQFDASERQDDAAIADSKGKAHVLYLALTDSAGVKSIGEHAVEYFKTACPDCKVTVKETQHSNIANIPSLISSALVSDPSIDYVLPQTDAYLAAAVSGIQNAGKKREVKLATTNAFLGDLQQMKSDPQLLACIGNNPPYLAWTMADMVYRMLQGQVPPGTYPLLNRAFTRQNIDTLTLTADAAADGSWYGPSDYQQAFKKIWGKS